MTDRYSARSIELAQQLKEKALSRFPLKCKWCDEPIVKRSSFGEDYYRHVSDHTAICEFEFQTNEVEPAMTDGLSPVQTEYFRTLEAMDPSPALTRAIKRTKDRITGRTAELAAVRQINDALPFAEQIALAEDETGS